MIKDAKFETIKKFEKQIYMHEDNNGISRILILIFKCLFKCGLIFYYCMNFGWVGYFLFLGFFVGVFE